MFPLDHIISHASMMYADREAVIDGDTRYTYSELGRRCRQLGSALKGMGIRPGDRVATLLANSHYHLELHLTLPAIGAVVVPINTRLAAPEVSYILEDCGARILVADELNSALAEDVEACVETIVWIPDDYRALLARGVDNPLSGAESEHALAGIYYTGGTTGLPKGVMLTHRNLVAESYMLGFSGLLERDMTQLYVFPLFHLASIGSIYANTLGGATQVLLPTVDAGEILRAVEQHGVTHLPMVPAVITMLLNHVAINTTDLSSLRLISHGAAPISPDLCREAVATFGAKFIQAYGMTEASAVVTLLHDEQDWVDHERIRSAGRVMPGIELVVRRSDGTACDIREPGEVTLRGPTLLQGYWNKPDETAKALRDGWYWTGDVGFLDEDHYLFLVDRAKDMIISGGENVYSVETECALLSHSALLECAVIGIPDEKWGEAVHAVVYLKPGESLTAQELIGHCRTKISGYKCPKSITFSNVPLPKSAVGKILKKNLRAPHWDGRIRSIE